MLIICILLFTNITLFANPCSAPLLGAAHSGAPGEVNCAGCHSGSINSGPGEINYQIGAGNGHYTPDEIISIILSYEILLVPKVSTETDTGSAIPMA